MTGIIPIIGMCHFHIVALSQVLDNVDWLWVFAATPPGLNAVEPGVLVTEPEDVAAVGDDADSVVWLAHLALTSILERITDGR